MNNLSNEFIDHLRQVYPIKIDKVIRYKTVYQVVSGDKRYILKRVKNKNLINNYNYLLAQKFQHMIIPVYTIDGKFTTQFNNYSYYLTPFIENINYPLDKRLIDYIGLLSKLHKTTNIKRKFKKDQFKRIYRKQMRHLNNRFMILDEFVQECETSSQKSLFMWHYLMQYSDMMFIKRTLLEIQKKIDEALETIDQFNYSLIHNSPSIDHLIVTNEKNYLISFDQSMISLKIYDYIKLFIEYCEYPVDWLGLIQSEEITNFEFYYFVFCVIYYIIMNIDVTVYIKSPPYIAINNLVHNMDVIERIITVYREHMRLIASEEVDQSN
jgi:hypothetical protein